MDLHLRKFCKILDAFSLQDEDVLLPVSDDHLQEIAGSHCSKWRSLPSHLSMKNPKGSSEEPEITQKLRFFNSWKKIEGSNATYKVLIKALIRTDQKKDAEFVCQLLKNFLSSSKPNGKLDFLSKGVRAKLHWPWNFTGTCIAMKGLKLFYCLSWLSD